MCKKSITLKKKKYIYFLITAFYQKHVNVNVNAKWQLRGSSSLALALWSFEKWLESILRQLLQTAFWMSVQEDDGWNLYLPDIWKKNF